jgi:hypothetical protein
MTTADTRQPRFFVEDSSPLATESAMGVARRGKDFPPQRASPKLPESRSTRDGLGIALRVRMRNVVLLVVGSLSLGACSLSESESQLGQPVEYFCEIEGSAIGHEGFLLTLGPKAVRFSDWVEKPGAANEYVGFTISIAGATSVSYVVKSSTETFPSSEKTWLHSNAPYGTAISNVDLCGECEDGSCGGGDGDGGAGAEGDGDGDGGGGECSCDPSGENCSGPLL